MHILTLFLILLVLVSLVNSNSNCRIGPCFPSSGEIASKFSVFTNSTCGQESPEEHCLPSSLVCNELCNATHPNQSHPATYINDAFNLKTFWKSVNIEKPVILQFDFGVQFMLYRSVVTFEYEVPAAMYFAKSTNGGSTFQTLAFYATDCLKFFNMTETSSNRGNGLAVECFKIDPTNNPAKQIEYGPMRDPVTAQGVTASHQNQTYFVMTNLRLVLVSYITPPGFDPATASSQLKKSLSFTVQDWDVIAACFCNGQASKCDDQNIGKCLCERNTDGDNCDRCLPLYNNKPYKVRQSCEACGCNDHADSCHYNTTKGYGICDNCTNNTIGDKCESCKIEYYRPQANLSYPCLDCSCHVQGSLGPSCHPVSGQCSCKPNVIGKQCDHCVENYFNITSGSGCYPCNCNSDYSTSLQCDDAGVCTCKPGVGGAKCTLCKDDFYNLTNSGCVKCPCSNKTGTCHPETGELCPGWKLNTTGITVTTASRLVARTRYAHQEFQTTHRVHDEKVMRPGESVATFGNSAFAKKL